jgi:predicted TIM-barrel fold metal-dependent hydrolase
MDFEAYNPRSTLVVPKNPKQQAKFPFIDVHSHHWRMATQDLEALVADMDSINMGVIVNLSGRGGEELVKMMDNIRSSGVENRVVLFTNIDFSEIGAPGWTDAAVERLEKDVENGAKGLKIFKSLGLRVTDINGERVPVDDPRLDPIWKKCGDLGIPILIHSADPKPFWMGFNENNERWLELKLRPGRKRGATNPAPWEDIIAEQHRIFERHPETTFINAHFGWYANDLKKLDSIMAKYPNTVVEFGAVIAELGRQPKMASSFFSKYQDRILFGKDAWNPSEYHTYFRVLETEDEYFPYYKRYHAFWRMYGLGLSEEILEKVYYKNALRAIPGLDKSLFD